MRFPVRAAAAVTLAPLALLALLALLASSCKHGLPTPNLLRPAEDDPYLERATPTASVRLRPELCRNLPDNRPEERPLDENALVAFLQRQGYHLTIERARPDLVYVDVRNGEEGIVRLRIAILADGHAAGQNLHRALVEHGTGSWGVHRSNLAVLAPVSSPRFAVTFAARTKLACWGVLTIADQENDFVVPGGYMEF